MEEQSLEKWKPEISNEAALREVLEKAFDYRGDVTLTLKDGRTVVGYIFNRNTKSADPFIQLYPADKDEQVTVHYKEIADVYFSGMDTAAGKSWKAWMDKYKAKEAAGQV